MELLESLFRVCTRTEISFRLHQNHLIKVPAILNQQEAYITVGTILCLRATDLWQSYTQESLAEIVIGRLVELVLLQSPVESAAYLQELIANSQRLSVTLKVTTESQLEVATSLLNSAHTVRGLSCLLVKGFPSALHEREHQSFLNTIAEKCAVGDMRVEFGEDALSRIDLNMFAAFGTYGFQKIALNWLKP